MWKVKGESAYGKFVTEKSFRSFYEARKYADGLKKENLYEKILIWEV